MTIYTNPGFTFAGQIGYSKDEIDSRLRNKANTAQVFTKTEISGRFEDVENQISTINAQIAALPDNVYEVETQIISANYTTTLEYTFLDPGASNYDVSYGVTNLGEKFTVTNISTGAGILTLVDISPSVAVNPGETVSAIYDGTVWRQIF